MDEAEVSLLTCDAQGRSIFIASNVRTFTWPIIHTDTLSNR